MAQTEIVNAFKCLGLETQEQRDSILSQGNQFIYDFQNDKGIQIWGSANTKNKKGEI
jgi:hypothetical protein